MKKLVILLVYLLSINYSAAQWNQLDLGTSLSINDIDFSDNLTGYFVGGGDGDGFPNGNDGVIYKTTDGGENWTNVFIQDSLSLNYVVANSNDIWAFGKLGTQSVMIHSTDQATNWTLDTLTFEPVDPKWFSNDIWYIDSATLKRYNDGENTTVFDQDFIAEFYTRNTFVSAATSTHLYYSEDSGITWNSSQFTTSPFSSGPYQSFYQGDDTLIAITQYPTLIYQSFDEGNTWEMTASTSNGIYFHFLSSMHVLGRNLFSSYNNVYHSVDGGQTYVADTLQHAIKNIYIHYNDIVFGFGNNGVLYRNNLSGAVGIEEDNELKKKIKLFPNPAKDILTVDVEQSIEIISLILLDIHGKIIKSYRGNERQLDVSGLVPGEYLLQFRMSSGTLITRVLLL